MNIQEAIAQMDSLISNSRDFHSEKGDIWHKDIEALNIAKQVLEKQIPKKPKLSIFNGYCPKCGGAFGKERIVKSAMTNFRYFGYCPSCGQKLDWSDTK